MPYSIKDLDPGVKALVKNHCFCYVRANVSSRLKHEGQILKYVLFYEIFFNIFGLKVKKKKNEFRPGEPILKQNPVFKIQNIQSSQSQIMVYYIKLRANEKAISWPASTNL